MGQWKLPISKGYRNGNERTSCGGTVRMTPTPTSKMKWNDKRTKRQKIMLVQVTTSSWRINLQYKCNLCNEVRRMKLKPWTCNSNQNKKKQKCPKRLSNSRRPVRLSVCRSVYSSMSVHNVSTAKTGKSAANKVDICEKLQLSVFLSTYISWFLNVLLLRSR